MLPFYLQERNETLIIILIDIGLRVGELVTFNGEYLDSALSRTYDFCRENNLQVDVRRIYDVDDGKQGRFGLTERQEMTLTEAYNHGYYAVPREVSLSELAETLDVSHQTPSERLRRSHRALAENAVIIGEGFEGTNDTE